MKRIVFLVVGFLLVGQMVHAREKKPIEESWSVAATPDPRTFDFMGGCPANGVEGQSRVTKPFRAPWAGVLRVNMNGFVGDWDVWLVDNKGEVIDYSGAAIGDEIIQTELPKKAKIGIMACNSLGGPTANLSLMYVPSGS